VLKVLCFAGVLPIKKLMKNLYPVSESGGVACDFMPEKEKPKRNVWTFEPTNEVLEEYSELLNAMGNSHGQRSSLINEGLKIAAGELRRRRFSALAKLAKRKAA
jgi:hypothetical protein